MLEVPGPAQGTKPGGALHALFQLCSQLRKQGEAAFFDNIPAEYVRLLEPHLVLRFGAALYLLIALAAAGIFAYLFSINISKVYLSPVPQSNCVKVDRPVTGSYLGDLNGLWSGTASFDPSRAPYRFELNNFSLASAQLALPETGDDLALAHIITLGDYYRKMLGSVSRFVVGVVKPVMVRSNYATNLLYLMMWSITEVTGDANNEQTFSFTGAPQSVFQALTYQAAGLASARGLCAVLPRTTFDSASQRWTVSWPYAAFVADANCVAALPPRTIGRTQDSDTIDISIDIRSFFAAVAANLGPPPVGRGTLRRANEQSYQYEPTLWHYNYYLKEVYWKQDSDSAIESSHVINLGSPPRPYYVGQYFDSRYPGMEAIY